MSRKPGNPANHLREWRELFGYTQPQLAERIRANGEAMASPMSMSNLELGKRRVSVDWLKKIAAVYQIPETWLMQSARNFSRETIERVRSGDTAAQATPTAVIGEDNNLTVITELEVRAGCGVGEIDPSMVNCTVDGCTTLAHATRTHWQIPDSYLHELGARSSSQIKLIEVWGDSMEPLLRSGDRAMVDTSDKYPSPEGIFALWDGIGVSVKRVEIIPGSKPKRLRISSENPRHGTYDVEPEEINIAGRVISCIKRIF